MTFASSTLIICPANLQEMWDKYRKRYDLKADILKYPHHGMSKMAADFYREVDPEYTFFTHGAGNTKEAQALLIHNGYTRMSFATWGMITMQTDGKKWIVSQEILPEKKEVADTYRFPE